MTRVARGAAFLLACAIAFAGLPAGYTHAQTFDPQPYLLYGIYTEILDPPPLVDLNDQFISEADVPVVTRLFFMNPVEKEPVSPPGQTEPITDPALHYALYKIDVADPGINYTVRVDDQFGSGIWILEGFPEYLLAPASKLDDPGEPGPPPPGQHYACYGRIAGATAPMATVDLTDQLGFYNDVIVYSPGGMLCVPVEKTTEGGTVYPIFEAVDGRDHLACYGIEPEFLTDSVYTRDQFTGINEDTIQILDTLMLCVPSTKTEISQTPSLAPWGIATLGLLLLLTVFWVAQRRVRYARAA